MSFLHSFQEIPFEDLQQEVEKHLQWAYAHGHLNLGDLEFRLEKLQQAGSKEELLKLVQDLPSPEGTASGKSYSGKIAIEEQETLVAFFSSNNRRGRWIVPRHLDCHAVFGSITLDLREAEFIEDKLTISGSAIFGSIDIRVPDNIDVSLSGLPFMGSISNRSRPDHPNKRVTFRGLALFGSIDAKTRPLRKK